MNATVTFKFRAVLPRAAAGTTIANVATLAYVARTLNKPFTFTGNIVNTQVAALADLAVTKSSSPTSVNAGGTVQYPITVTNNGPTAATGVSVVDTLPATLTFVSAAAPPGTSCSASGQVVTCDGGTLANGASLTFTVTATVPPATAAGSVVNTVRVLSATSDDTPANDTAAATTTITRAADMVAVEDGPDRHGRRRLAGHLHDHGAQRRPVHGDERDAHRSRAGGHDHRDADHRHRRHVARAAARAR